MQEEYIRLECACGTAFHTMKFELYEDDYEQSVSVSFDLQKNTSFWDRLRYALGFDVVFGGYDNVMVSIADLENVVEWLKSKAEESRKKNCL